MKRRAGVSASETERERRFLDAQAVRRESHSVESLLNRLPKAPGHRILDLGMLNESTPKFFGSLGHNLYSASLLHAFDSARAADRSSNGASLARQRAADFVRTHLAYPENTFQAVLAWDVLQHLDEPTTVATIAQLAKIIEPTGSVMCLFHGDGDGAPAPVFECAIESRATITIKERGRREARWQFSPRRLEALFPQFRAVHFHLKRDAVLEVLVLS